MNIKLGMIACAGLVATVGLTFGCGDSTSSGGAGGTGSTSTGTTTGTTTSSTKAATSTGSGTTTTTTTSGSGTSSTGGGDDCATYCATITTNCTGANKQFDTSAACMTACTAAALPPGKPTDAGGATLGCHIYHATVAAQAPDVHCWHAGLPGYADHNKAAPGPCN